MMEESLLRGLLQIFLLLFLSHRFPLWTQDRSVSTTSNSQTWKAFGLKLKLTTDPKKGLTGPLPWGLMVGLTVGLRSFMKSMNAFRGFLMETCCFWGCLVSFLSLQDTKAKTDESSQIFEQTAKSVGRPADSI